MADQNLLTPKEVATELRVTVQTVHRYLRRGQMKCLRLSRKVYRISRADLIEFMAGLSIEQSRKAKRW